MNEKAGGPRRSPAFIISVAAQGLEECWRVSELLLKITVAHGVLFDCNELRGLCFPIQSQPFPPNPSVFEPVGNEMGPENELGIHQ